MGGDDGEISDAADVEANAAEFGMTVKNVVGERDERSALAAERHVSGTEVGDGGDAGKVGNHGAVAKLQRGCGFCAEKSGWSALVEDSLAVVADQIDARWSGVKFLACG